MLQKKIKREIIRKQICNKITKKQKTKKKKRKTKIYNNNNKNQ